MNAARGFRRKAVLIVLFVPSVDREQRAIDQDLWTARALEVLGTMFGGATAFPRARTTCITPSFPNREREKT